MSPCMLLKGSPVIDWLIVWVREGVSEWVAGRGREHTDALHHITRDICQNDWFHLFCCSQLAQSTYVCALVCAWPSVTSVFPHASWALSQQNPCVFWYYLVGCLQCQNGNCLAGSVLMERFATINLLIYIERMAYGYQSNMVCNANNIC